MAGENRSKTDALTPDPAAALTQRLKETPWAFDFFQAVRRMECALPGMPSVGQAQSPQQERVRFCQEASLAFATSTVHRYEPQTDLHAARLFINFFGLLGPNGPMPLHFTDLVHDRELNHKDHAMARFLDLFNHRMISLFYRAWAEHQQTISFERGEHDRYSVFFGSLFGIGMESLRNRDAVPDIAKLHYSGHLVGHTRHAEGLQSLLSDFFKIQSRIEQFVGRWIDIPQESTCRLGLSRASGELGRSALVGSRMWDCQQKFRIQMGPMSLAEYQRLLPSGNSLKRLVAWVRNYAGDQYAWDVRLILRKTEVPSARLGKMGQLGWTLWLNSRPAARDADDLVIEPRVIEPKVA
jgi:type VI secretion system protein ImpH